MKNRRVSDTRSPICTDRESSSSCTASWWYRSSAWPMSVSDVHWFSTASTRNPVLSSLIHFWMQLTISPSLRWVAAIRNASSVSARSSSMLFRRSGMLSSTPSACGVESAAKRWSSCCASSIPFQQR